MSDNSIHQHIVNISESMGRIEAKIDAVNPKLIDHEDRIRKLEKFKWIQMGGAAVVGTVVGWAKSLGIL